MSDFDTKLKKMKKSWKEQRKREPATGFQELEEGVYILAITEAKLGESKKSKRLQVAWTYTVQEGDSTGQKVWEYDGIETEENLYWLMQKMLRLDREVPDDIGELEPLLEEITQSKPIVRARVIKDGDFTRIRISKLLEREGGEDPTGDFNTEDLEDDEDEDTPSEEIEVGSIVDYEEDDGSISTGTVTEVTDDVATVNFDGEEFEIELDDLTLSEDEVDPDQLPMIHEGDKVIYTYRNKEMEAKVTEVTGSGIRVKAPSGRIKFLPEGEYELAS